MLQTPVGVGVCVSTFPACLWEACWFVVSLKGGLGKSTDLKEVCMRTHVFFSAQGLPVRICTPAAQHQIQSPYEDQ